MFKHSQTHTPRKIQNITEIIIGRDILEMMLTPRDENQIWALIKDFGKLVLE